MNSERKAFEEWYLKEFGDNYTCPIAQLDKRGEEYIDFHTNDTWLAWKASAQRQGYKLVPVEMSWQKADELASKEWDKNKSMFCADNRDMSALQVEEFRLRWCKNKAHQIMSDYKSMIGAVDG